MKRNIMKRAKNQDTKEKKGGLTMKRITMKYKAVAVFIIALLVCLLVVPSPSLAGGETMDVNISNPRVEGAYFKFEIQVKRTNAWAGGFGNCDWYFNINAAAFTGVPSYENLNANITAETDYTFVVQMNGGQLQAKLSTPGGPPPSNPWTPTLNVYEDVCTVVYETASSTNSGVTWDQTNSGFLTVWTEAITPSYYGSGDIPVAPPTPPTADVTTPTGEQSWDVTISYTLTDPNGDNASIVVQYSEDGGTNWTAATMGSGGHGVSGLTTSPSPGIAHTYVWDSFTDLGYTNQDDIRIKITPSDSQPGTPGQTGDFTVNNPNTPPTASVTTPTGVQSGDVTIEYTLSDPKSDVATIAVEYSEDGGTSWNNATMGTGGEGTSGLATSPGGTAHTYVWNSLTDIGYTTQDDIRIKITPSDTDPGTPGETVNFSVDNANTPPTASVTTPTGEQSEDVTINYTLTDANSDDATIVVQYSEDSGTSWDNATMVAGQGDGTTGLTTSPSPGTAHTYVWDSLADIGYTNQTDIRIKIAPSDAIAGAGTPGETSDFAVNNFNLLPTVYVDGSGTDDGAHGTGTGGDAFGTIQYGINAASPGGTLNVAAGTYNHFTVDKELTLKADGVVTVGPGSDGATIDADGVQLIGFTFDGTGSISGDDGIQVNTLRNNTVIKECIIHNWHDNGINLAGSGALNNLQILDTRIYSNGGDGILYASGVSLSGVQEVYGNQFKDNTGAGINNSMSSGSVKAEYNSWGHINGPSAGGDGISGDVDADPWTFLKMWVEPATQNVREGYTGAVVNIKFDAHKLYGAEWTLSFDKDVLQVVSITEKDFPGAGGGISYTGVADANSSGQIAFCGNRRADQGPPDEFDGTAVSFLQIEFEGQAVAAHTNVALTLSCKFNAKGGINIYPFDITDGQIRVWDTTDPTGRVDLQGRSDDSGATVDMGEGFVEHYDDPSSDTTDYWGAYDFSDVVVDTYTVLVVMERYLDAEKTVSLTSPGDTPNLGTAILLGGDVVFAGEDKNKIDISDITSICGVYNPLLTVDPAITVQDVNADGVVDISDLVLAAGNYDLTGPTTW